MYIIRSRKFAWMLALLFVLGTFYIPAVSQANQTIRIFINGKELVPEVPPVLVNNRTMVPLRAISEALGAQVDWQPSTSSVIITTSGLTSGVVVDKQISIMGQSVATSAELRSLLRQNNPSAPDLVDLYLNIGRDYGVRGDIAFCQAAKETGWWKFGNEVQPEQNNYCGLSATGSPMTGLEDLRGADPNRVHFAAGQYGAYFDTPATGVEAHIQHLYAYASKNPLPIGKTLLDPRFKLVSKGVAPYWTDLNGRWAVPGDGYGESILNDYYAKALQTGKNDSSLSREEQLEQENQMLKAEIARLKS
ncbi:MAG TPA: stalk domain-containing protein [Syntrophomonadaceae bacterium]|nr:stalk domain-containing protein [Syntrophomonadaceae bacterium]